MGGPLEWFGAIGAAISAGLIAADLGRRVTGWAFVLFCATNVAWIVAGVLSGQMPLVLQNVGLLAIDAYGVWQFLINPKKKREIEKVERLEAEADREIKAEDAASA